MNQFMSIKWSARAEEVCYLNLDEGFDPFLDHKNLFRLDFKRFEFAGGEPHFQITTEDKFLAYAKELIITQRFNSVNDIFDIVLAVDAARRSGGFEKISLILPYFPAARQDRVCNVGEPLTIKIFADIINSCNFAHVHILTPHSEVTPALINNVVVHDELKFVAESVKTMYSGHHFNIVCPDAGAGKRVQKAAEYLTKNNGFVNFSIIRCEKVRDVKDGSIKEFFVADENLNGYPTLILDDLNSKGGTFLGLAAKLREKNCGQLSLFTTHSDCVEGINNVARTFDKVFTTNSKQDWNNLVNLDNFTCHQIKF